MRHVWKQTFTLGWERYDAEANGAACAKAGSHAPRGGTFPGPCEIPGAGGSARDAEGPGINPKFPGKGVNEPGVHAAGAGGNTAGEGGTRWGRGVNWGARWGRAPGSARGHGHSLRRTKHPV
ncbi:hypothetical protein BJV77DRAFT_962447 [Russula vinacea]|nr:hypothetical protein BJV77DRAFT_962447 [Russula vinacea]